MARKPKLTEELIEQVRMSLQNHNTKRTTAELVGVAERTFYLWMAEGEKARPGTLKHQFYQTVKESQAMSVVHLVNKIAQDPAWQAKAWLLERMHPQQFGRRQLIAHAGADGESDLPAGAAATPVNLTINMQGRTDPEWEYASEQDPEPENGSDPWDQERVEWKGEDPPEDHKPDPLKGVEPPPEKTRTAAPSRGPSLPNVRATGRPTDPDDHQ